MSFQEDGQIIGKPFNKGLSEQEVFEAKQNLVGFFHLLYKIDKRINPHLYENKGNPDNPDQSPKRLSSDWERSFRG